MKSSLNHSFLLSLLCASSLVYPADRSEKTPTSKIESQKNEKTILGGFFELAKRDIHRVYEAQNGSYIDKNFTGLSKVAIGSTILGGSGYLATKHAQLSYKLFRAAPGVFNKTYTGAVFILSGSLLMYDFYKQTFLVGGTDIHKGLVEAQQIIATQSTNLVFKNNAFVS